MWSGKNELCFEVLVVIFLTPILPKAESAISIKLVHNLAFWTVLGYKSW